MLLGLIGSHIQASRTPAMHEAEARHHGLRCLYQLLDLDRVGTSSLPDLLCAAEWMGFAGLNITHPCKQAVMELLDELSPEAAALGAVNTVVLRNGRRVGYNTDWLGFRFGLAQGLGGAALGRVVQLGAGGAGAATAYAALRMGVERLTLVDTDRAKAEALAERLADTRVRVGAAEDAAEADGLIHATPMGMANQPGLPLEAGLLRSALWVAEIVYFPLETELLRVARAAGCRTVDGGGMAVGQAAEAFRLFSGLEPDAGRMRETFLSFDAR